MSDGEQNTDGGLDEAPNTDDTPDEEPDVDGVWDEVPETDDEWDEEVDESVFFGGTDEGYGSDDSGPPPLED